MPANNGSNPRKQYMDELEKRHVQQEQNSQKVLHTEKLDDDGLRRLDSTLKKTTAFMKKIRNIGTASTPTNSLMPELQKLNLSKFLDELAASIAEAKFKSSEITNVVDVCVFLSSRYKTFPENLISELKKTIPFKKSDKITNPSKLRVDIRFLAELVLNGVFASCKEGLQLLGNALSCLMISDKAEHVNIGILLPLCKSHAIVDMTDVVPAIPGNSSGDLPRSSALVPEQRRTIGQLFRDYMRSLIEHANAVRVSMNKVHRHIKKQERTRGDASNEDRVKFDELKAQFVRLYQHGRELGECLGINVPTMTEEPSDDEEDELAAVQLSADINQGRILLWPDDDTRRFYENLHDLCRVAGSINAQTEDTYVSAAGSGGAVQDLCEKIEDIDLTELEQEQELEHEEEDKKEEKEGSFDEEQSEEEQSFSDDESHGTESVSGSLPAESAVSGEENRRRMDEFLDRLSNSINREMIDRAAQDFAFELYQNKRNRKRLSVYMIEGAPKDRLDLLPFFARFLATIHQIYPDYVNDICKELIGLFREYVKFGRKRLEVKIYVVNFTGELIKFGVVSKAEALNCLRMLMFELKQSNVDLMCCLIESVGSFLYKSPESHSKMKVLLEVMNRKKEKIKDPRQQILLDNAYYSVVPPEDSTEFIDTRLPVDKEYIMQRLNQRTNRVATLRKIDWADDDTGAFALGVISDPTNVPFGNINQLAQCVAALSEHHDWLFPEVLDNILERIRLSLEIGVLTVSQQTIADVVYLGYLYNYEMCECRILMQVLYQLISFNVAMEDPRNLLRVRLVAELCRVISDYFKKGSRRRKLDIFLPYFYRFYWTKKNFWQKNAEEWGEIPLAIEACITEMLHDLNRDDFPDSLEAANNMVERVERSFRNKILEARRELHPQEFGEDSRYLNDIIEEEGGDEIGDETEPEYEDEDEEEFDREAFDDEQEDGDEEDDEEDDEELDEQESDRERDEEDEDYLSDVDDEEEHIHVHTERRVLPEDEQFMNDLDRMLNEAYMTAPVVVKAPAADLTIPPSAIQKLDRKISFQTDVGSSGMSLAYETAEPVKPEKMKMALLTRGKGNKTILKSVSLDTPKNLEESWRMRQAQREKEHNELKKLTLKMNERIMNDDDTDHKSRPQ